MKTKCCLYLPLLFISSIAAAQMKIGNNSTSINSASLLELETTNKGFVLPRISLTNVSSSSPLPSGLLTGTLVYNTNASVTNGNGTGLYVWTGSSWVAVTNATVTAWGLTGNAGTTYATNFLGTTDNAGFRIRTNNIERLLIDSLGDIGIGSSSFNATSREKLLVDYGTTTSHTIANLRGSIDGYLQINLQNQSSGINASTDYVATADDGTDSTYYVDFGINSSTYSRASKNWGSAHDAYLYAASKNLLIGTASTSDLILMTGGGVISTNTAIRIKGSTGNVILGRGDNTSNPVGNTFRGPNASTSSTNVAGGDLTLQGGSSTGTATGGSVYVYGGSTVSGTAGSININASNNSATNINTGTSTGTVTIGNSSNSVNLPGLTASKVVFTDASKNLASSGTVSVSQGGTGLTTLTANNVILGNGTSSPTFVAPGSSGNFLVSNGTTWYAAPPTILVGIASYAWVTGSNATNSTTTLTDVTGLSILLGASGTYEFEGVLQVNSGTVGNSKNGLYYAVNYTGTASNVTGQVEGTYDYGAGGHAIFEPIVALNTAPLPNPFMAIQTSDGAILIKGTITTTSTGNFSIRHAIVGPVTTNYTSTVYIGSYLKITRIQ